MNIDPRTTLATLRGYVRSAANKKGTHCPCCGQFAKTYHRSINETMAGMLMTAYNKYGVLTAFHISDITGSKSGGGGDFSKLKYWGLIHELLNDDLKKKNSGQWVVTLEGHRFLMGNLSLPRQVVIYNGEMLGYKDHGDLVRFKDCLGENFDYRELMA